MGKDGAWQHMQQEHMLCSSCYCCHCVCCVLCAYLSTPPSQPCHFLPYALCNLQCYCGDISRKKKLLAKQAEGKKRAKMLGKVSVPQSAFMAVLKINTDD